MYMYISCYVQCIWVMYSVFVNVMYIYVVQLLWKKEDHVHTLFLGTYRPLILKMENF